MKSGAKITVFHCLNWIKHFRNKLKWNLNAIQTKKNPEIKAAGETFTVKVAKNKSKKAKWKIDEKWKVKTKGKIGI